MKPFMFAAGIEHSQPAIDHGRIRRDQMAEHDRRPLHAIFTRVKTFGRAT